LKRARIALTFIFIIAAALTTSGCRYRILHEYYEAEEQITDVYLPPAAMPSPPPEVSPIPSTPMPAAGLYDTPTDDQPEPTEPILLTYIEAAADNHSPLTFEIENDDARQYSTEADESPEMSAGIESPADISGNTLSLEEVADDGQSTLEEQGGVVAIVTDHSALLMHAVGSLFPCQMYYIYAETAVDHVTVGRGSVIYQLMANAGGVNISTRLSNERLTVTDDWVVSRNPNVIVKFTESTILGNEITDIYAANEARRSIAARPGWGYIDAVVNNRIILLSEQMLESEETRLAAKLIISHMMYPALFSELDVDSLIAELMDGMTGVHVFGNGYH